jgi:hypothetical protein
MVWHDHVFIECRARKTNRERQHFFANQGFDRTHKVHCTSSRADGDEIESGRRVIEIPQTLPLSCRVAFHEKAPTQTWFRSRADPDRAGRPRSAPTIAGQSMAHSMISVRRGRACSARTWQELHRRELLRSAKTPSPAGRPRSRGPTKVGPYDHQTFDDGVGAELARPVSRDSIAGRPRSAPTTRNPEGAEQTTTGNPERKDQTTRAEQARPLPLSIMRRRYVNVVSVDRSEQIAGGTAGRCSRRAGGSGGCSRTARGCARSSRRCG